MDTNITSPPQETVSQSEVEGLLAQMGEGSSSSTFQPSLATKNIGQPLVFRRLSSFSVSDLRKLRVRHEEFIQSLAARLSGHLRLEVVLKMSKLETMPFKKFIDELSNPTYLALLRLEPLKGTCLLEIPPQLGLSVVDRELGGPGIANEEDRALSDIESGILSKFVEITFNEWCMSWKDKLELRPILIAHESNGAFVQSHCLDTTMLVLGIEMQIGDLTAQLHFGFPYLTLEPIIQRLNAEADGEKQASAKPVVTAPKWNPVLNDMNVKVIAELPGLKITARELTKLKLGDVIVLEPEVLQNIKVSLAKKPKFLATVGRCGPRWAVKITKLLNPT